MKLRNSYIFSALFSAVLIGCPEGGQPTDELAEGEEISEEAATIAEQSEVDATNPAIAVEPADEVAAEPELVAFPANCADVLSSSEEALSNGTFTIQKIIDEAINEMDVECVFDREDGVIKTYGEELIVNGSFEDNQVNGNRWGLYNELAGWERAEGAARFEVQQLVRNFGPAADGGAWVELDSTANMGVIQRMATENEAMYEVSFAYTPRPRVSADSNTMEVYWNGELVQTLSEKGDSKNSWSQLSLELQANDAGESVLEFRAAGKQDSLGAYLDNVSVKRLH